VVGPRRSVFGYHSYLLLTLQPLVHQCALNVSNGPRSVILIPSGVDDHKDVHRGTYGGPILLGTDGVAVSVGTIIRDNIVRRLVFAVAIAFCDDPGTVTSRETGLLRLFNKTPDKSVLSSPPIVKDHYGVELAGRGFGVADEDEGAEIEEESSG